MSDIVTLEFVQDVVTLEFPGPDVTLEIRETSETNRVPLAPSTDGKMLLSEGSAWVVGDAPEGGGGGAGAGAGVWAVTRDTGLKIQHERSVVTLGDISDFPYFGDGNAGGFLKGADGVVRHYQVSGVDGAMSVTTVEQDNIYAEPYQAITVTDAPMSWIGGGPILDLGGGEGLMILHQENEFGFGPIVDGDYEWLYMTLGIGKVVDPGNGTAPTVTWLGSIIHHQMTPAEAEAGNVKVFLGNGHFITDDEYLYLYYIDRPTSGGGQGAVARCSLAALQTAFDTDSVPVFNKWNGEALDEPWTELGLGGDRSTNDGLAIVGDWGDMVELPDGRYLWGAAIPKSPNSLEACEGTDPLTWAERITLETDTVDDEWVYATLWSGDPDSPKKLTQETAQLYFLAGTRWSDMRTEVATLRPVVKTPDQGEETIYQWIGFDFVMGPGVGGSADNPMPEVGTVLMYGASNLELPEAASVPAGQKITIITATLDAGPYTITPASGEIINGQSGLSLPSGSIVTLVVAPGAGGWLNVNPSAAGVSALAPDGSVSNVQDLLESSKMAITPDSLMPIATTGSALFRHDTSITTNTAIALGQMRLAYSNRLRTDQDINKLLVSTTATALASGEGIVICCYEVTANDLPGALLWSEVITIGTTIADGITATLAAARRMPDRAYTGVLNPSTNSGTVTLRCVRPLDMPYEANTGAINMQTLSASSLAAPPANFSAFFASTAALSDRFGVVADMPLVLGRG